MKRKDMRYKRDQIIWVDFGQDVKGSEHKGLRPAYIISNNIGNQYSGEDGIVKVLAIGTKNHTVRKIISGEKKLQPTQTILKKEDTGLEEDSILFGEQAKTIAKERIKEIVGQIHDREIIKSVNKALMIADGLIENF